MTEDLAQKYGVPFFHSAVGEANVVDLMLKHNAILGGEGNGGVIDPRVGLVRDSFVGMAMLLEAMVKRSAKVSQLADELPKYAIHKSKFSFPTDALTAGYSALEKKFSEAKIDRRDGLRLNWNDKWLLVRAATQSQSFEPSPKHQQPAKPNTFAIRRAKFWERFADLHLVLINRT